MMLESWRRELLDLGLRNPLLNYRLLKARGVQIIDERSAYVYNILVKQQKTMSFTAAAVDDGEISAETQLQQPSTPHTDEQLQTTHSASDLQKRLLNSDHSARTIISNRGINVMYLALGMLRWYESGDSNTPRRAPLILIPVTLERANINDHFHLRYTGVDLGENLSLRAKLQQTFNITLPPFVADNTFKQSAYFHQVQEVIRRKPRWSVEVNGISLGFFSFSKFMLYSDLLELDQRDSPLLKQLLSTTPMAAPRQNTDGDVPLDEQMKLTDSHLVLDADSSQMRALLDVRNGRNLVIQGPPGTGKSQTITNLIADAVGRGKTVLFVSEKMAALDVVKRRLDGVGVGDGAMVLHSHRTTRGDFYNEMRQTLELGAVTKLADLPTHKLDYPEIEGLQEAQSTLIAYSEAVNRPISDLPNPYDLYGRQLALNEMLGDIDLPARDPKAWRPIAHDLLSAEKSPLTDLQAIRQQTGQPDLHPFFGTQHADQLSASAVADIDAQSNVTLALLARVRQAAERVTNWLQLPPLNNTDQLQPLLDLADHAANAPKLKDIDIHNPHWQTVDAETVADALEMMMQSARLRQAHDKTLLPEAYAQPVVTIRQGLMSGTNLWGRLTSADYKQARNQLAGLCHSKVPSDWDEQLALIDTILSVQRLEKQLAPHKDELDALFGERLKDGQWHELARATYWLHTAHNRNLPKAQLDLVAAHAHPAALRPHHEILAEVAEAFQQSRSILWQSVGLPANQSVDLNQLDGMLRRWEAAPDRVNEMTALNRVSAELRHLAPIIDALHNWPLAGQYLAEWAELRAIEQVLDDIRLARPLLNGVSPHISAEKFRQLDRAFLQHNRLRLAQLHWTNLPRQGADDVQTGVMANNMRKLLSYKRPTLPIRQFMQTYAEVVFQVKPVFMMSPLAIATFLPSKQITFDLVIFDEASQVRPAEALGAIARAKQLVVVGDSRQLPPTSFFESIGEEEPSPSPSQREGSQSLPDRGRLSEGSSHIESILDLCVLQRIPERMLRWHYRSRHESLIAIANSSFYDHNLVIFPSPDRAKRDVGLNFRYVPQGVYQRGKSRRNPIEAHAVAQAVMAHAKRSPDQTLGVATFSSSQREAVTEALEKLRLADPSCESFFNAHEHEPFFVKNLENVQGDERDVILISVGYGKGQNGKLWLNFGPLNAQGGERRLNVLTTRARRKCDVFANFRAHEIDLKRTSSIGVAALKRYLSYAETGEMATPSATQQRPPAQFETHVAQRLTAADYVVTQRVGSEAMQVDLAVADPSNPQQFILGIECDADSHRAEATRDRDRIQGEVLTGLGWQVFRLYLSNWWRDEEAAFTRLLAAIEAAKRGESVNDFGRIPPTPIDRNPSIPLKKPPRRKLNIRKLPPYQAATKTIDVDAIPEGWQQRDRGKEVWSKEYYYYDFRRKQVVPERPSHQSYESAFLYYYRDGDFSVGTSYKVAEGQTLYFNGISEAGHYILTKGSQDETLRYTARYQYDFDTKTFSYPKNAPPQRDRVPFHRIAPELIRHAVLEVEWIMTVVSIESPIHTTQLYQRILTLAGFKRHAPTIQERVHAGLKYAKLLGLVRQQEKFVWLAGQDTIETPRNRRQLSKHARRLSMIADEEVQATVQLIIREAQPVGFDTIEHETKKLLGALDPLYGGKKATETRLRSLLNKMQKAGTLIYERGYWQFVD